MPKAGKSIQHGAQIVRLPVRGREQEEEPTALAELRRLHHTVAALRAREQRMLFALGDAMLATERKRHAAWAAWERLVKAR